ncbi:MAG: lysophospholipid acyltransferase family protein [Candidatus Margulisiibacteriota bacterium]
MVVFSIIYTFYLYFLVVSSFFLGISIVIFLSLFFQNKERLFQSAAHLWAKFLILLSGIKVSVHGLENIPRQQPVIFAANHQSAADIPILLAYLPVNFRFAIKKELFYIPIFGWYLRKAGYFSIDREAILSAYKTLTDIIEIIKLGGSVLIFPEGTRSYDGNLGKFKKGSLMAALKAQAPLIPIAISGSYHIMPRKTWLIRPYPVKLSIGKPIYIKTREEYENKVEEVRRVIAKML